MRWTGRCREMSGTDADGEVVWSWRAHAGAKLSRGSKGLALMTVANAGSPGRTRISRKPPRREGRLSPPVPVVFALAQLILAREPRVHAATRSSLRPPYFERVIETQSSGEIRRENVDSCSLGVMLRESGASSIPEASRQELGCLWNTGSPGPVFAKTSTPRLRRGQGLDAP